MPGADELHDFEKINNATFYAICSERRKTGGGLGPRFIWCKGSFSGKWTERHMDKVSLHGETSVTLFSGTPAGLAVAKRTMKYLEKKHSGPTFSILLVTRTHTFLKAFPMESALEGLVVALSTPEVKKQEEKAPSAATS